MNATTRRAIDTRLAMSAGTLALLLALISAPIAAQQLASDTAALAAALIESGGVTRGVCGVIGADRDLAVRIAESSELLVHVREPDAESVAEQRRQADAAGLGIDRLVVERGEFNPLPYADNTIDLLVATAAGEAMLSELSPAEVLRVLCPGGTARIGSMQPGAPSPRDYREWARLGGVRGVKTERDTAGTWLRVTKPLLDGADDWPHWEHGPDNNPVSTDSAIKAPYLTQFLAEPYHITMPSITTAAGGRTFLATGHIAHHVREWEIGGKLIARNGYNGTVLWQRNLPEGYLAHRSAFYATDDVFHMIDGDSCLMLDARTGDELGRIRVPGTEGDWKWMATDDGVLYVMSGDRTGQVEAVKGDRNFGGWGWGDLSPGYYTQPRVPWG
ncbi:MAG TPA: hypothetical protein QGH10_26245, partial [Armatimonadota bacterium]|nr:hypothetical protein [Armatimonadota bacterium]